jgi:hypothetical protein
MTYYDKEFDKLKNDAGCIKVSSGSGSTRWLNVTPEQIKAILEILNKGETE